MSNETKSEITMSLACFFYAFTAVIVKYVSYSFTGLFISLFRFITGIFLGLIVLKITKQPFKIHNKKTWLLRGIFGSIAMGCYYTAIQITSSGRATLLFNTYPIFVALFGFLFFKEKISINNVFSLILCLCGAIVVFYDGSKYNIAGDFISLAGGILGGITVHYIKKSREKNHPVIVYMAVCFIGLLLFPFTINQAVNITFPLLLFLCLISIFSFIAQVLMTYGYKFISATKGSIIFFLQIILTILLSFFIGEEFKLKFFIGIMLILLGLFINKKKELIYSRQNFNVKK